MNCPFWALPAGYAPPGVVLMGAGRPDEPRLIGDSEEIQRFREAARTRIERAAADVGRDLREIPPAALLSLLCASAFSAVAGETAGAPTLGLLSSRAVLGDLISAAIDGVHASSQGRPPSPLDLEREIHWRIEHVLAAQDQRAAVLRAEIAEVLADTDALRSALSGATETGNDRLRNDVISAIDTLSSGYPEVAFLVRTGDHEAAQMQRRLDGQGAEFRALGEMIRSQSADVRIAREDVAAIRHREARGEAADAGRGPRWDSGCPYRGLLPFDQEHAGVFFGRQRLTAELIVKLAGRLAGPSMVVVSGASGAGKSSLLRAGLLPALAAGSQLEGSDGWPRIVMTPTGDPLTELATRLARLSHGGAAAIRHGLAADPDRAHLVVGQAVLDGIGRGNGSWPPAAVRPGRLVLAVDQFEEVFTLAPSRDAGQQAFIAALCAAASQPFGPRGEPPAVVVIAVRGDFWARCAAHAGLARLMQDGMFVVGPMTGTELQEAITGPAAAAGLQIDADLADTVLADLRTAGQDEAEGILPLLSQAMMLTWQRRDGNRLTVQGYHESGGVARSVEFGAEAVYEALPDAGQQIARDIFRALVLVGPDGQLARRAAPRAELAAGRRQAARRGLGTVLEAFASSRLLVLDGDTVQIAHDVLLRAWPRLRGWLDSEQANWMLYTQLQEDAAEWAAHGRDRSFLYRGSQLAAVEQAAARWAADPARYPALTGDRSGFLEAGQRFAARSSRLRRALAVSLILALAASLAGGAAAVLAARKADQQRNNAISSQVAAQSEALDIADPVLAAQLAGAAWQIAPTSQARDSMLDAFAQPDRAVLETNPDSIGLEFTPDGKTLAVNDGLGVQLWNVATRRQTGRPIPATNIVSNIKHMMAFSPDGRLLATNSDSGVGPYPHPVSLGTVQLWDVATRHSTGPPINAVGNSAHVAVLTGLAFSPDGKMLATSGTDRMARLWNVATRHQVGPPIDIPGKALNAGPVAFSPKGTLLATGGGDGTVRLWNVATHDQVGPPINVASVPVGVVTVAFSPDGRLLVTESGDGTVQLWDVATHHQAGPPISVISEGGGPGLVSFSPDGMLLATAGRDGIQLWNVATSEQAGPPMEASAEGVNAMAFSPDGKVLAAIGGDGTVRLLDVAEYQQIGQGIDVGAAGAEGVALSADGRLVAAAGRDGLIRLQNITTQHQVSVQLPSQFNEASSAYPVEGESHMNMVFASQHEILAVQAQNGLMVLDVSTRKRIFYRTGDCGYSTVALSSDGNVLAFNQFNTYTCNVGNKVLLWDLAAGRMITSINFYGNGVGEMALSTDGRILATVGDLDTVRLWEVATGRQIGRAIPAGTLSGLKFSPDGSLLATAEADGTVRLWDVATQQQVGLSMDASTAEGVNAVAFTPDGSLLATAGGDGTVRLWDVATQQQVGPSIEVGGVSAVAFSPDATLLTTLGPDNAVRLWDVTFPSRLPNAMCSIVGHSLTPSEWKAYIPSEPYQRLCS